MDVISQAYEYHLQPRYNWNIVESGIKHHNPNPEYYLKLEVSNNILLWSHFTKSNGD
jgi:hypothetical protein